ncbi:DUF952 domain-containing protein [Nocardioides sp.]|uniref:DUF952 domain-containing protein n=1 Tax=Nocardioides sp. TaxID=35761 RepID=UPI0026351465|nr:DUF952 domain-containing protein [Nocardioides sp.]
MQLFHIATVSDWEAARRSGFYTTSTVGRTLQEEGFLHASRSDQWEGVRERYYGEVREPLVLLVIDSDRLTSPWREDQVGDDTFPHIYGPLNPAAVLTAIPLGSSDATPLKAEPAAQTPLPQQQPRSQETFAQVLFGEMAIRAGLVVLAMALSIVGEMAASAISDSAGWVGALLGLIVGIALAVVLYRRREQRR